MSHRHVEDEGNNPAMQSPLRIEHVIFDRGFHDANFIPVLEFQIKKTRQKKRFKIICLGGHGFFKFDPSLFHIYTFFSRNT